MQPAEITRKLVATRNAHNLTVLRRPAPVVEFPKTADDKIMVCCRAALECEDRGEYERAYEAIEPFWEGPGSRPQVEKLNDRAAANLLLRAGSLTASLGSKRQIDGWQECAKDLLSEAAARFESLRDLAGWGWVQKCLALCYWRVGALQEGRVIVTAALERLGRSGTGVSPVNHAQDARATCEDELWVALLLVLAIILKDSGENGPALELCEQVAPAVAGLSHALQASFYMTLSNVRENLGDIDAAIIEATAAAYYYEQATHANLLTALNNLANLDRQARNFEAAHAELDRAERVAGLERDRHYLGHLKDTRALTFIDEGRFDLAVEAASQSVGIYEKGDETTLLVHSLTTLARATVRAGCARTAGRMPALQIYLRAYELAADRIGSVRAAEIGMEMLCELAGEFALMSHVTLDQVRTQVEKSVIRRALEDTNGNITAAGLRIGHSQQSLSFAIKSRHPELMPVAQRKPAKKSIVRKN
jgi:tetratricopeptide (TPR) repeat protein